MRRAHLWSKNWQESASSFFSTFRLHSFDTSTEQGRAQERNRRGAWTTITHVVARGLEASTTLVSVPLTIGYLGKERYGLWMAIGSILTWIALADFGMLRGLQNRLSDAYGRNDNVEAQQAMSTAFYALLMLALGAGTLFGSTLFLVPWEQFFKLPNITLQEELRPTLLAVVGVFCIQFPLRTVKQAYAAYQRGYIANLFAIVGSLLSLAVLLIVIWLQMGLPWLILASGGVTSIMSAINLLYITHDMPFLLPHPSAVNRSTLRALALISVPMMLFEFGSLMINEIQMLILAHVQGVDAVTDYAVYLKVMSVPLFLVNVLDSPYVPMYREALTRGDHRWFRKTFNQLQWIKVGVSVGLSLLLVFGGDALAGLLSAQSVQLGSTLWILAGLAMIVGCWNGSYNNLFFALERIWTLVWIILANGVVTFALTLLLTPTYGMTGILIASTAFSLLISGWLLPVLSRDVLWHKLKRLKDSGSHRDPSLHLLQNQALGAVRERPFKLDPTVDRARMHHQRTRLCKLHPCSCNPERSAVITHGRQQGPFQSLALNTQRHHDIRTLQRIFQALENLYAQRICEARQEQCTRANNSDFCPKSLQQQCIGASYTTMRYIPTNNHTKPCYFSQSFAQCKRIEKGLCWVLMGAITRVENGSMQVLCEEVGST